MSTEKIVSFEAVVRWNDKKRGKQNASDFVYIMEEMGLITLLDNWVIGEICSKVRQLLDLNKSFRKAFFNVSASKFYQRDFLHTLSAAIKKYGIDASLLEIELTERLALNNIERAAFLIKKLKSFQFSVAIDDFGTGYSALSYLKFLPVNTLKLDKEFIVDVGNNHIAREIASSVIDLAKNNHFNVICEGVETKEQLDFLKTTPCDTVQGYYYYHPIPFEELAAILDIQ